MADEVLRFDIIGRDNASGAFSRVGGSVKDMGDRMNIATRSALVLDEALRKQSAAARASADATLAGAKAAKILADAEHVLADGALEADFALKREAEAAKKSGRAAVEAAAENRAFADSLQKVADSAFFKGSPLGTAIALSPALIPLAGGIAAGIGAIGISFGAAAVGAGLFGLAAKSVLSSASTNLAKLQALEMTLNKATTPAAKKSAQASIDALKATWAPGYLALIGQLETFKKTWTKTSQTLAIPALSSWLGALTKGMPLLATAVKPVADVFQLWGKMLRDNFANPAVMAHLQGLAAAFGKFSASQLTLVGRGIADIALGVFHLGHDLAGSGANFSAAGIWFMNMGAGFLAWSKSSKARADVQGFMHYLHQEGPVVGGILSDLGKILPGIFKGATTAGTLELQAISGFLGFIAGLPKGWQQPLTEAAGAMLLLSKTGVISTGLKLTFPKKDAGRGALAASLGMKLIGGALIVPATVMIIGSLIPKDTSKQAAKDFKNQPGIVVKVSDFLHTTGMGAWVDQYFSHPVRAWAENSLPHFLGVAGTKISDFFTRTIPQVFALFRDKARLIWDHVEIDVLQMVFKISGYMGRLPGPLGAPFREAHKSIGHELAGIQADAAKTARQINSDWNTLHGKKVALTFGLNLPAGVSFPSRHIKGRGAKGIKGAAAGTWLVGEEGPELAYLPQGTHVLPAGPTRKIMGGLAGGTVGDFTGNFPSAATIRSADGAMQGAINSIAAAVKGMLHIDRSAFTFAGGGGAPGTSAQVASWIRWALAIAGKPASWLGGMEMMVRAESGGNPLAANRTPAGLAAGGPEGIAQTIPSTFAAYAMPGHGNIWNPIDDLIASARYIGVNYGSPYNIPGLGTSAYQGYDHGGFLPPGLSLAYNGTGRPEPVGAAAGGGSTYYTINVAPTPLARPADIGREVVAAIREHERRAGKSWRT